MGKTKVVSLVLSLALLLAGCFGGTTTIEHTTGSLLLTLQIVDEIEVSTMAVELKKDGTTLTPEAVEVEDNAASLRIPMIQVGEWHVRVTLFHDDWQVAEAEGQVVIRGNTEEVLTLTATALEGSVSIIVDWERVPAPVLPPHTARIDIVMQHQADRVVIYPQFRGIRSASLNVAGFHLYRSFHPDGVYTFVGTSTWDASGLVIEDRSIVAGATHYYKLTSLASDGRESWPSPVYSLSVAEIGQPLQPFGATADRRPQFEWTGADGYTQYTVHLAYRTFGGTVYQPIAATFDLDLSGPNPSAIPQQDLAPGEYQWYVVAHEEDAGHVKFFVTEMDYFTITP